MARTHNLPSCEFAIYRRAGSKRRNSPCQHWHLVSGRVLHTVSPAQSVPQKMCFKFKILSSPGAQHRAAVHSSFAIGSSSPVATRVTLRHLLCRNASQNLWEHGCVLELWCLGGFVHLIVASIQTHIHKALQTLTRCSVLSSQSCRTPPSACLDMCNRSDTEQPQMSQRYALVPYLLSKYHTGSYQLAAQQ
jgi:hypothetical protein